MTIRTQTTIRMKSNNYCPVFRLLIFFLFTITTTAQVYPVKVNTHLNPPFSLKLSDYATLASEKLTVTVNLADVTEFNRQIKFRFRLTCLYSRIFAFYPENLGLYRFYVFFPIIVIKKNILESCNHTIFLSIYSYV